MPAEIVDARSALQLVAENDHRWPDGRLYVPAHLDRRGTKRHVREVLRIEAAARPVGDADRRRAFVRAGGDCVCDTCGLVYYDHPRDIEPADGGDLGGPALTVLCDRTRVKL